MVANSEMIQLLKKEAKINQKQIDALIHEKILQMKGLIEENTALFMVCRDFNLNIPDNNEVEELSDSEEQEILNSISQLEKPIVLSENELNLFLDELKAQHEQSTIVKLQEYCKTPRIFTNFKNIQSEKLLKKGRTNFYSAKAFWNENNQVKSESVMFFIPTSLLTRINNLIAEMKIEISKLKLLVRFNGIKQSNITENEFFSFYSKSL